MPEIKEGDIRHIRKVENVGFTQKKPKVARYLGINRRPPLRGKSRLHGGRGFEVAFNDTDFERKMQEFLNPF